MSKSTEIVGIAVHNEKKSPPPSLLVVVHQRRDHVELVEVHLPQEQQSQGQNAPQQGLLVSPVAEDDLPVGEEGALEQGVVFAGHARLRAHWQPTLVTLS